MFFKREVHAIEIFLSRKSTAQATKYVPVTFQVKHMPGGAKFNKTSVMNTLTALKYLQWDQKECRI